MLIAFPSPKRVQVMAGPCYGERETIRVSTDGCINGVASLGCKHGTGRWFKKTEVEVGDWVGVGKRGQHGNIR
jgi:hypothetical protein